MGRGATGSSATISLRKKLRSPCLPSAGLPGPMGCAGEKPAYPANKFSCGPTGPRKLKSADSRTACPGDHLILRTPGGGGAGESELLA